MLNVDDEIALELPTHSNELFITRRKILRHKLINFLVLCSHSWATGLWELFEIPSSIFIFRLSFQGWTKTNGLIGFVNINKLLNDYSTSKRTTLCDVGCWHLYHHNSVIQDLQLQPGVDQKWLGNVNFDCYCSTMKRGILISTVLVIQ